MTGSGRGESALRQIAAELDRAELDRRPVSPLTQREPGLTVDEAYQIQRLWTEMRLERGDRIAGYKLGLTSRAMQEMLGVDQPDYGPILSSSIVADGGTIESANLIAPRAEAEIGFLLKTPLRGPGVTPLDVLRATHGVFAALEVIDSRIQDWKIQLADTIADKASTARIVLGGRLVSTDDLDLRLTGVVFEKNGEVVQTGAGAAALGNPANAVAWAANTLGHLGVTMEPGHVILPGALHAAVPVGAGDTIQATFDRLGVVRVRFA